ncbi:Uncharacterised protein [Mycobacteroides abscessus subsp. abscessus]|jgi:hypothetical protein|nr:Uncharacterised protein [Mycobacteroides abscessus subsp. abscessus]SKL77495.1 Uncharacterised protein [Mycobacteroides abscessus subsp. abscessus]SKM55270.1 Uncharacterised protein [Mycobacteroides abscessus subsp. abscessus]SLK36099.1 Uncharacterised protein [Mycobacteroides abscessus subsp. abscessus]
MARVCYHTDESYFDRATQQYTVARITENVPGYEPWTSARTLGEAVGIANRLNTELMLLDSEVNDIYVSSIRLGSR